MQLKFLSLLFLLYTPFSYSQDSMDLDEIDQSNIKDLSLSDQAVLLSLKDAIEIGLRKNNHEITKNYQFHISENIYKNARYDLYFPKLSLKMSTNPQFLEDIYRDNISNQSNEKTPDGFVGLVFDQYTLFNWGKDYLTYVNAKEQFERQKENLDESKRETRFLILEQYFKLAKYRRIVEIYKKQLKQTSFIYRLAKEKRKSNKIKYQELLDAKSTFLDAHKKFHNALAYYQQEEANLANILGDDPSTTYKVVNQLKYFPLTESASALLSNRIKENPRVKDALLDLRTANRNYEKSLKENLPLPKFTVNLGAYKRTFSNSGLNDDYNTFDNSNNVELVGSIDMSWTIFGSGGFLNSRVKENAYFKKRVAQINYNESIRETKIDSRYALKTIQYLEQKYKAVELEKKNARDLYDVSIDGYVSSKLNFVSLRNALYTQEKSLLEYENTKYEHLFYKIYLAKELALYDFPGERFEDLTLQ